PLIPGPRHCERSEAIQSRVNRSGLLRCTRNDELQEGCANLCNNAALSASAGKNASIASSDRVMSTGVPKIVTVDTNEIRPAIVSSTSGTAMLLTTPAPLSFAGPG